MNICFFHKPIVNVKYRQNFILTSVFSIVILLVLW